MWFFSKYDFSWHWKVNKIYRREILISNAIKKRVCNFRKSSFLWKMLGFNFFVQCRTFKLHTLFFFIDFIWFMVVFFATLKRHFWASSWLVDLIRSVLNVRASSLWLTHLLVISSTVFSSHLKLSFLLKSRTGHLVKMGQKQFDPTSNS